MLHTALRIRVTPPPLVKVILVCDSINQAEPWRTALALEDGEILCVTDATTLTACESALLAVVDVTADKLVETLKALRLNDNPGGLHIFVIADRVVNEPQLAGVLPQFRAMACGQSELIQLARRRLYGIIAPIRRKIML
jgi:hypothetical protein